MTGDHVTIHPRKEPPFWLAWICMAGSLGIWAFVIWRVWELIQSP